MLLKSSSYVAGHHPNTYMEQFCRALHPNLELGTVCVAWFRQATKHCTELLSNARVPTAYFWTTFKNFIFPDRSTEIISQKVPISIHPERLSVRDCQSLFLDIVSDYIQRAPRYSAESTTNVMLWQVLYSFLGILVLGSLLMGTIYAYNKYGQPKKVMNFLEEIFKPAKCMQAIARRSLRLSRAELRNIHIKPLARAEDIAASDRAAVLAFKVGTKRDFLEAIVEGSLQTKGKLHRLYENKTKSDFKIESLKKAMKFLDNDCKKLHLILMFEDDVDMEEELAASKSRAYSPRSKMISPRYSSPSQKGISNYRLEGGSLLYKATHNAALTSTSSNSSRPASPRRESSPRTLIPPHCSSNSSIPRNFQKRLPTAKKSK